MGRLKKISLTFLLLCLQVQETLGVMVIVYLISLFVTVFLETPVNKLIKLYVK